MSLDHLSSLIPLFQFNLKVEDSENRRLRDYTMGLIASQGLKLNPIDCTYDTVSRIFRLQCQLGNGVILEDTTDPVLIPVMTIMGQAMQRIVSLTRGAALTRTDKTLGELVLGSEVTLRWALCLCNKNLIYPTGDSAQGMTLPITILIPQKEYLEGEIRRRIFEMHPELAPKPAAKPEPIRVGADEARNLIMVEPVRRPLIQEPSIPQGKPWNPSTVHESPSETSRVDYHPRLFTPLHRWLLQLGLLPSFPVGQFVRTMVNGGVATIGHFAQTAPGLLRDIRQLTVEEGYLLTVMVRELLAEFPHILTAPPKEDFLTHYVRHHNADTGPNRESMLSLRKERVLNMDLIAFLYHTPLAPNPSWPNAVSRACLNRGIRTVRQLCLATRQNLIEVVGLNADAVCYLEKMLAVHGLQLTPMSTQAVLEMSFRDVLEFITYGDDPDTRLIRVNRLFRRFETDYGVVLVQDLLSLREEAIYKTLKGLESTTFVERLKKFLFHYNLAFGCSAPSTRKDVDYPELLKTPLRQFLQNNADLTDLFLDRIPSLLEKARYRTVRDLLASSTKKLYTIKGVGTGTIEYLRMALRRYNLRLPLSRKDLKELPVRIAE